MEKRNSFRENPKTVKLSKLQRRLMLVVRRIRSRCSARGMLAFAGVFAGTLCLMQLFPLQTRVEAAFVPALPAVGLIEKIGEEEDLRDSAPLFLPTRWNSVRENLAGELDIAQNENLSFGGVFFLDFDDNKRILAAGNLNADERDVFIPAQRWELSKTFGKRGESAVVSATSAVRLAVIDFTRERIVFYGEFADGGELSGIFDESKMLLGAVEIFCCGAPTRRQFYLSKSSGDSTVDAAALSAAKSWAREHLRRAGNYRFQIGK